MSSSETKQPSPLSRSETGVLQYCVDCQGDLKQKDNTFFCPLCERHFKKQNGVWDFRPQDSARKSPEIFDEKEFHRWQKIFREEESKNWVIYKNSVFRFFAQAGHRVIGKRVQAISESGFVLEIGAGTGAFLEYFPDDKFIAVDVSMESLIILKTKWPKAICVCASSTALPFRSDAFNQVVSLHTLEHLYFLAESLQEIRRVLKPNGLFHYGIPTEGGLAWTLGRRFITGPHLQKKFSLDVQYVMDREHINDAARVLKFLRMHFDGLTRHYWPLPFARFLTVNALIYGVCRNRKN